MAGKLFNLARMTTATTGTGTITLGAAVSGYLSFAGAGAVDGDVVSYGIQDGANSEVGTGTYTASGTSLTRTVTKSTNSNTAISLSGTATVFVTPRAEDLGLQSKIISASRNLAASAGSVSYTGVGFKPSSIIALAYINATFTLSAGFTDSGAGTAGVGFYGPSLVTSIGAFLQIYPTSGTPGNNNTASVISYDADGFTLSWAQAGSPTGTATIYFLCMR